ncbi:MAG: hypothetical protein LIP06_11615 [Tannerellaceae bacterium]|nr:hypothetical protein [Tannerellaceae bacterium]
MEKIFYVEKQKASNLYRVAGNSEFRYIELTGKETKKKFIFHSFQLLFPQEGTIRITSKDFSPVEMNNREGLLLPKETPIKIEGQQKATILLFNLDVLSTVCEKDRYRMYYQHSQIILYDFTPTPLKQPIIDFTRQMVYHLKHGLNCEPFHELKGKELLLLLQAYYSHEEMAFLLYPLLKDMAPKD